jgi:hypothetical protein
MEEPLRVWFPGEGYLDLDRPGKNIKWDFYSRLPPGIQLPAPLYFLSPIMAFNKYGVWRGITVLRVR